MIERTTPENINSLTENQIFVFGSNLSGRHGKANPNFIFLVTEIGCGLAGLKPKDVAPLFKDAVNVQVI
jgi:hypothetical protein